MPEKFIKVNNLSHLIPVLEQRLPESCFIFNQLKFYEKIPGDMEIFTFGSGRTTWILTKYLREDYGAMFSISAPSADEEISKEVTDCLASNELINWDEPFLFTALQNHVTKLIVNITVEELGRIITIYPTQLFYMEPSDAMKLQINDNNGNVQVKRLDIENGTQFIANNWKYCIQEKTHAVVRKSIESFPSGGIYVDGELVTGAITPAFGLISMLHTDPEHRRKGYASIAMQYIFKEMAREGLQPCLVSECENKAAVKFHTSLGLQPAARLNYLRNN